MKITLQLQLLPDAEQATKLRATVERFNEAANWIASELYAHRLANKIEAQKLLYHEIRERFGLSAQMTILCIHRVVEAYKRDRNVQPTFSKHAAITYDTRTLSFRGLDRASVLTLEGRISVPLLMGRYQQERFTLKKGQSDLVLRGDGKWFLLVTADVPDGTPIPATDFIGVDLGVENLATTSDGDTFSGEAVEKVRTRYSERRRTLQKAASARKKRGKRPRSIRRALKRTKRKEARFRRDVNHVISKRLVAKAKGTERGIALEDLSGIRERTRFRRPQRARMSGWAFHQLRSYISYKSRLAGVPVEIVDAAYTSQTCSACGYCEKANRVSQAVFSCRSCGHSAHADENAARNIRARASVMTPMVSEPPQNIAA